ncbi:MAG TPA: winged helix-turn-helix domain-containing protein [Candidatus Levybacteria bacterium]|nr:winged helix-turn-helix domain-containing protein [Candidatus Levybacteria bacterium]
MSMGKEMLQPHKTSAVALDIKGWEEMLFTHDLRLLDHNVTYLQNPSDAMEAMNLLRKKGIFLVAESSLGSLQDALPPGTIVTIPSSQFADKKVAKYLDRGADHVHITSEAPEVLSAHMQTIQNRMNESGMRKYPQIANQNNKHVEIRGLKIDLVTRKVEKKGKIIPVTKNEFEILFALAQKTGEFVSYQELISLTNTGNVNNLRAMVSRLQKKLEENEKTPRIISSIQKKGYILPQ